jgi:hypothetical protein
MRGPEEQEGDHQTWRWYASHGFSVVDVVETAFAFPSLPEAQRVLGFIMGRYCLAADSVRQCWIARACGVPRRR